MKLTFTAAVLALAASAHASSIQVSADKLESRVTHGHTQPHKCITFGGALQGEWLSPSSPQSLELTPPSTVMWNQRLSMSLM